MALSSYAKINLTLNVNSRGKNNLHEIQSCYCLIDLKDKIELKKNKIKKDKVTFTGRFAKLVNKSNNSVINILKQLRDLRLISNYYSVTVKKNIPVFAGLGGGTGNAASIINHLLKKKITKSILNRLEDKTGSDLKLFFYNQGFLKNLRSITELKLKQRMFFILIQPSVKCSTKEIYSNVRNYSKKKIFKKNLVNKELKFISYLSRNSNELQSIVEKKFPIIKKLLSVIQNEDGCYFSRMTGSGSVCYGLFNNQIKAKKALRNLKKKYPNFWTSLAKTV